MLGLCARADQSQLLRCRARSDGLPSRQLIGHRDSHWRRGRHWKCQLGFELRRLLLRRDHRIDNRRQRSRARLRSGPGESHRGCRLLEAARGVRRFLNEPVSSKITFVFVPDAGGCQGIIEAQTSTQGRKVLLLCGANVAGEYLMSLSANQAGTIITGQSIRNDEGQVICGSLHFGCQTDSDCCIGFDCQEIDAGPTRSASFSAVVMPGRNDGAERVGSSKTVVPRILEAFSRWQLYLHRGTSPQRPMVFYPAR